MSHEELEQDLESQVHELREQVAELVPLAGSFKASAATFDRIAPWVKLLVGGAFLFGSWAAVTEWRQYTAGTYLAEVKAVAKDNHEGIEALNLWRERAEAQRVTAAEMAEAVAALREMFGGVDKRLQRTEDTLDRFSGQLDRFEQRLSEEP